MRNRLNEQKLKNHAIQQEADKPVQDMKDFTVNRSIYDEKNEENLTFKSAPGINEKLVREISKHKQEPEWMLQKRLKGLELFKKLQLPKWGPDISDLDLSKIHMFMLPNAEKNAHSWEDVPQDIKNTFKKLGIPEAEHKALGGVGAQYECLSGDSLIFTNNSGLVKIRDIKKGDKVFSFDEKNNKIKEAKVLRTKEKGKNKVYEVIIDNKKIKATENHPCLTLTHHKKEGARRGRYKREWKSLKDLKKNDLVAVAKKFPFKGNQHILNHQEIKNEVIGRNQFNSRYKLDITNRYNKVTLPKKTTEDLMWFFGLYIGDGYIKREKGKDKVWSYLMSEMNWNIFTIA